MDILKEEASPNVHLLVCGISLWRRGCNRRSSYPLRAWEERVGERERSCCKWEETLIFRVEGFRVYSDGGDGGKSSMDGGRSFMDGSKEGRENDGRREGE